MCKRGICIETAISRIVVIDRVLCIRHISLNCIFTLSRYIESDEQRGLVYDRCMTETTAFDIRSIRRIVILFPMSQFLFRISQKRRYENIKR